MNVATDNTTLSLEPIAAAPPALPLDMVLTLVARRPPRLPQQTFRAVMDSSIPVASRCRSGLPSRTSPDASIVIVTFNNLVFTRMCLASLLANTDRKNSPAYEVIVVDNASSDGTADYLRAVAAVNPHVRIILNDTNRGFAPANNQALAQARGDLLVLLNNDTIVPPAWLEGLSRHLQDPAVGLVGPVTNRIGNEAEIEVDYTTYGQFLDFERQNGFAHRGQLFDIPTPCMFCLAMRRDAYERIGPLDERFLVGMFEDDDYALRATEVGYRLVAALDVFVHHFGQASFGELVPSGEYSRLLESNKQQLEIKWGRPWQPRGRRPNPAYEDLKQRIRRLVPQLPPPGTTVLVVSKGDEELLKVIAAEARRAWHFPQAADGSFAGYYPADSQAAIAQLEVVRARGAEFLLFPRTAFWWLEHYRELRQYLESRYRQVLWQKETALIYALCEGGADEPLL